MNDINKTKEQLINELNDSRRHNTKLKSLSHKELQNLRDSGDAITEKRLEYLLDNCPAVIYTCEFGGNWSGKFMSENVKRIFGYKANEFNDDPTLWINSLHPEDKEQVLSHLDNLKNHDYHALEYRFYLKDGTYRWVSDEVRVIRDQQGNALECVGYWTDITERKRVEQQSEEHTKRLTKLYELSMMLSGDPIDIFQDIARMIGELLNVRVVCLSEIRDNELFFISVYVDGKVMTNAGSCLLSITPCATVQKTKDIRVFDHVSKMFPEASFLKMHNAFSYCGFPSLSSDGNVNAVTCLLDDKPHDFSEDDKKLLQIFGQRIGVEIERQISMNRHIKAEKEREHLNTKLAQKNKELEQILYVTSHDLRTPLINIDGYSKEISRLLKELGLILDNNELSSEVREKIDVIVGKEIPQAEHYITTSASKMDALLSGLLQVSRLGRFESNIEKIDMNNIISEIIDATQYQVDKAGAKIETVELPSCSSDKNQTFRLFSNLIDNALKYLDSNRKGAIRVTGKIEGNYSVYCVEDNGIGISPDYQKKIFDIFYQLKPKKSTGEGLGLTIVKKIVDINHGKIWVESEPGTGSKFYVSLPN